MCDYAKDAQLKQAIHEQQYQNTGVAAGRSYRPTPLEDMAMADREMQQAAELRREGMAFLSENPAFNQFIALIRKGAIAIAVLVIFGAPMAGCGAVHTTTPPAVLAPGYANAADQTLGESLLAVKSFAAQETINYNQMPADKQARETKYLNTLISAVNVADGAYLAFHAGTQTLAQAQTALQTAQGAQSSLVAAKGVK